MGQLFVVYEFVLRGKSGWSVSGKLRAVIGEASAVFFFFYMENEFWHSRVDCLRNPVDMAIFSLQNKAKVNDILMFYQSLTANIYCACARNDVVSNINKNRCNM